jgi:hypothetical protein
MSVATHALVAHKKKTTAVSRGRLLFFPPLFPSRSKLRKSVQRITRHAAEDLRNTVQARSDRRAGPRVA